MRKAGVTGPSVAPPVRDRLSPTRRTFQEIIAELKDTTSSERSGRAQDQEDTYAMQKLRARGYM